MSASVQARSNDDDDDARPHPVLVTRAFHVPSDDPSQPAFDVSVTTTETETKRWAMVWAGVSDWRKALRSEEEEEASGDEADGREAAAPISARLADEWAVSMVARPRVGDASTPAAAVTGTSLFRTPADVALPMSQRLCRRLSISQLFLSLDLPPHLFQPGSSLTPEGSKVVLLLEKRLGEVLGREIGGRGAMRTDDGS